MSISYVVDPERQVVTSHWTGEVTIQEIREHWVILLEDPAVRAITRSLADVRAAQFKFNGEELRRAVVEIAAPRLKGRKWCSAIVISDTAQYGVSRQFEVFSGFLTKSAIFRSVDEAEAWILGQ